MPRGRIPRPWYRASTRSWFVSLDGRQVPLGKTKREAHAEFNRLMTARGQGVVSEGRITVKDLADLWIADCSRRLKVPTLKTYRSRIGSFVGMCGTLEVRVLKPYHLSQWVAQQKWSQSAVHSALTVVKLCIGWGRREVTSRPIRSPRSASRPWYAASRLPWTTPSEWRRHRHRTSAPP